MGHTPNYLNSKPHPMAIMHVCQLQQHAVGEVILSANYYYTAPRASAEGIQSLARYIICIGIYI